MKHFAIVIRKQIFDIVVYTLIAYVTLIMINHVSSVRLLTKMDSGILGNQGVSFYIKGDEALKTVADELNKEGYVYTIFRDDSLNEIHTRYLYINKMYPNIEMKEGRFLLQSDCEENRNVVVIGKEMNPYVNGSEKKVFSYGGYTAEVVGVVGYDEKTPFDSIVFSPLLLHARCDGVYTVDFFNGSITETDIQSLCDKLNNSGIEIRKISTGVSYGESRFSNILIARWFVVLEICCVICVYIFTVFHVTAKRRENSIRRLVGASVIRVCMELLVEAIIPLFVSSVICIVYCIIKNRALLRYIKYMSLFTLLLIGFTVMVEKMNMDKIAIKEGLNE